MSVFSPAAEHVRCARLRENTLRPSASPSASPLHRNILAAALAVALLGTALDTTLDPNGSVKVGVASFTFGVTLSDAAAATANIVSFHAAKHRKGSCVAANVDANTVLIILAAAVMAAMMTSRLPPPDNLRRLPPRGAHRAPGRVVVVLVAPRPAPRPALRPTIYTAAAAAAATTASTCRGVASGIVWRSGQGCFGRRNRTPRLSRLHLWAGRGGPARLRVRLVELLAEPHVADLEREAGEIAVPATNRRYD